MFLKKSQDLATKLFVKSFTGEVVTGEVISGRSTLGKSMYSRFELIFHSKIYLAQMSNANVNFFSFPFPMDTYFELY